MFVSDISRMINSTCVITINTIIMIILITITFSITMHITIIIIIIIIIITITDITLKQGMTTLEIK